MRTLTKHIKNIQIKEIYKVRKWNQINIHEKKLKEKNHTQRILKKQNKTKKENIQRKK